MSAKVLDPGERRVVESRMEQAVYEATVRIFERMERDGVMRGNGHHAAQKVAQSARKELEDRWWKEGELFRDESNNPDGQGG